MLGWNQGIYDEIGGRFKNHPAAEKRCKSQPETCRWRSDQRTHAGWRCFEARQLTWTVGDRSEANLFEHEKTPKNAPFQGQVLLWKLGVFQQFQLPIFRTLKHCSSFCNTKWSIFCVILCLRKDLDAAAFWLARVWTSFPEGPGYFKRIFSRW